MNAKQLVDRAWAAIESGEIDTLDTLFDPDAVVSTSAGGGSGIGYIKALFTRHRLGYPDIRHRVLDAIESPHGDAVALRIEFEATHLGELRGPLGTIAPTGRRLVWRSADVVRAGDGRIVSWHAHFDRLTVLDQLGQLDHLRPPEPALADTGAQP